MKFTVSNNILCKIHVTFLLVKFVYLFAHVIIKCSNVIVSIIDIIDKYNNDEQRSYSKPLPTVVRTT